MTILLADSGSTKTDWALLQKNSGSATPAPLLFSSHGLNPCLMNDEQIVTSLEQEVFPIVKDFDIDDIRFYGAGCRPDQLERMQQLLCNSLHAPQAKVASDLLGAAHALCGKEAGIIAILGTGSGSAVFDGERFVQQTPSLGFILGDEGSGSVLGRRLVGDIFKGQLPKHVCNLFFEDYPVTIAEIIENVYRGEAPNRYLAQFTKFLSAHRDEPNIQQLLIDEFRRFFHRNIRGYNRPELSVNFVGSIASVFEPEIQKAAALEGFSIGNIIKAPLERLIQFYC